MDEQKETKYAECEKCGEMSAICTGGKGLSDNPWTWVCTTVCRHSFVSNLPGVDLKVPTTLLCPLTANICNKSLCAPAVMKANMMNQFVEDGGKLFEPMCPIVDMVNSYALLSSSVPDETPHEVTNEEFREDAIRNLGLHEEVSK